MADPTVLDPRGKARALYEARRTRRPIAPFTDTEPHLTLADGYAIQRELVPLLLADGDRIVGYKVGLTSLAMRRLIGVDSPDFGPVLASTRYPDGGRVPLDRFIAPKVEAEITYRLGERLQCPQSQQVSSNSLRDRERRTSDPAVDDDRADGRCVMAEVAPWSKPGGPGDGDLEGRTGLAPADGRRRSAPSHTRSGPGRPQRVSSWSSVSRK